MDSETFELLAEGRIAHVAKLVGEKVARADVRRQQELNHVACLCIGAARDRPRLQKQTLVFAVVNLRSNACELDTLWEESADKVALCGHLDCKSEN